VGRGLIFFRFLFFLSSFHPDVIFMEGHTEEEEDTNQEVLNKLSRRHSYSNILDIQLGPHSSPETKKFKAALEHKLHEFDDEEEDETAVNYGGGAKEQEVGPPKATMDPRVTQLITTITDNVANLASQVHNLSTRVDTFATDQETPILMVPQRVKINMNESLGTIGGHMNGLIERVKTLERRSNSPIMMVPQYQQSPVKAQPPVE
jgi:hypothetical protein